MLISRRKHTQWIPAVDSTWILWHPSIWAAFPSWLHGGTKHLGSIVREPLGSWNVPFLNLGGDHMCESICKIIYWALYLRSVPFIHCTIHMLIYSNLKKLKKTKKSCEKITRQHKNTWNKCRLWGEISFCFRRLSANQRNSKLCFPFYFWFSWIWFSTLTS